MTQIFIKGKVRFILLKIVNLFAEFELENSKLFCFVRADKTFQFYGFVELIVHGASLLSLWNLMSSWVCGKSRKPKTRKTMCCEDSIFKDSFMEKNLLFYSCELWSLLLVVDTFFATSLILRKNEDSKKVDDRLWIVLAKKSWFC